MAKFIVLSGMTYEVEATDADEALKKFFANANGDLFCDCDCVEELEADTIILEGN